MRLDKFLKITRIIKRRTVAKELADNGNISINGEEKKSSYSVKKGDVLDIKYFNKNIKVRIKELPPENLKKDFIDEFNKIENDVEYAIYLNVKESKEANNIAFSNTLLGILIARNTDKKSNFTCNIEKSEDDKNHFWLLKHRE